MFQSYTYIIEALIGLLQGVAFDCRKGMDFDCRNQLF